MKLLQNQRRSILVEHGYPNQIPSLQDLILHNNTQLLGKTPYPEQNYA